MAEQKNTYKRRAGVDAWRANKFEWGLTVLAYLRCQRLHEQWKKDGKSGIKSFSVANNVDGAGNFDDIVVRVEYVDSGKIKNKTIFVQCKYISSLTDKIKKKKLFLTKLFSDKAVAEYAYSFAKIHACKNQIENKLTDSTNETQNVQEQSEENLLRNFINCNDLDIEVLFYSNIGLQEDYNLGKYQLTRQKTENDITTMIFSTSQEDLFESRISKTNCSVEQNKVDRMFIEEFRIFVSQADNFDTIIEKEIKLLSEKSIDFQRVREFIIQEVQLHFTSSKTCYSLTEKDDILSKIINFTELRNNGKILIENFCRNTKCVKNIFSEQSIYKFQNVINSENKHVIKIESKFPKFDKLKFLQLLVQSKNEFTLFSIDDELDKCKWDSARRTRTYKEIEKAFVFSSKVEIPTDCNRQSNETLIQIIESREHQIAITQYANEFSPETERHIQNKQILFQGEQTDIKSLCGNSWKIIFDENMLINMLENKSIEIGTPLSYLDFYIERYFQKENIDLQACQERVKTLNVKGFGLILFSETDECIPGHNAPYKVFKNMEEIRIFVQIFLKGSNNTFHLCSFTSSDFEWIYSFGVSSFSTEIKIIKEDSLLEESKTKISIISDIAGMGKTTTLLSLAKRYKQQNPSHWVFFIELNKYLHQLKNVNVCLSTDDAIEFTALNLLNLQGSELVLFTDACNISGNVILYLDAFDEISPEAEDTFSRLLLALEKTKISKIFVSSKPNYVRVLEDRFLQKSVKFQGLTTTEKETALERYWKQILREDFKRFDANLLKVFVKRTVALLYNEEKLLSEILTIPLQIRMVAMIFYQSLLEVNFEERIPDIFPIDLAALYEDFIHLHAERFYVDKLKIMWNYVKSNQKQRFLLEKLKGAEEIACEIIIPEVLKDKVLDRSNEVTTLCDDVGIITNKTPVVFLHRTIAEYLAAKYIVREIIFKNNREDMQIVTNILMDEKLNIVRKFINSLLVRRADNIFCSYEMEEYNEFNETPIHVSASEGNVEILRCLLPSNVPFLNLRDLNRQTALHRACYNAKSEAVKFLLSNYDCSLTICDKYGNTVFHVASRKGYLDIIQLMLQCEKSLLNMQNNIGCTPLHEACCNGQTEVVMFLLSNENCSVKICNKYGDTVLHFASEEGDIEIMQLILQRDQSLVSMQNGEGSTPLHLACSKGKTHAVKFLLFNNDCSVNICDKYGGTVLHDASREGCVEIMKLILQRDHSLLNMQNKTGYTPLHEACIYGKTEAVKFLLSRNDCSVNICDNDGETILHDAAYGGCVEIMQLILQRDQTLFNMQSKEGCTPLHRACFNGKTEAVKFLLSHSDCSVNICDKYGNTVFHVASRKGYTEIMQIILKRDHSLLNMQDNEGFTPLHQACCNGQTEAVKFLLSHKDCSVNICDQYGDTVLHTASREGYMEIMDNILQRDQSLLNI